MGAWNMGSDNVRQHYSRRILVTLAIVLIVAVAVVVWQREFLVDLYLRNQITYVGWIINGGILALFGLGIARLVQLLVRGMGEEAALSRFVMNLQRNLEPTDHVHPDSLIGNRYGMLLQLAKRRAPINQNALAAALVANESSNLSFPKFVNNVLILTGVFGTIVSLSIALLGASDLLGSSSELGGIGTVIHGMSTALSTTMTAIFCYLVFGYFYLKLTDAQTYIISRVEQITTTNLMPRFVARPESVLQDFSELVQAATTLIQRIDEAQLKFAGSAENLEGVLREFQQTQQGTGAGLEEISEVLGQGFRVSEDQLGGLQNALQSVDHGMGQLHRLLREGFRLPEEER